MPTTAQIGEKHRIVGGIGHADLSTDRSGAWVLATDARRILAFCQTGAVTAADEVTVTIEAAEDDSGTGDEVVADATEVAPGTDPVTATVEVQAAELPEGKPYVRVTIGADAAVAGAGALLFGGLRYAP